MSTTIHLSPQLLESVDRRANELGVSRNRYIVQALEQTVANETRWSSGFLRELAAAREDAQGREALTEMTAAIAARRTRKPPPEL